MELSTQDIAGARLNEPVDHHGGWRLEEKNDEKRFAVLRGACLSPDNDGDTSSSAGDCRCLCTHSRSALIALRQ